MLQASHTSSGMRPRRCRKPKIAQPRQKPTNASSEAATISTASRIQAAGWKPVKNSTTAAVVKAAPMPWAKRLGGPATSLACPILGAKTFTDSSASGEIRGPNSTRSQKPAASATRPQAQPVSKVATASTTTSPAVIRAAYSLTGFGKANTFRQSTPPRTAAPAGEAAPAGAEPRLAGAQEPGEELAWSCPKARSPAPPAGRIVAQYDRRQRHAVRCVEVTRRPPSAGTRPRTQPRSAGPWRAVPGPSLPCL